ncbi:hypothetical protein EJB05_27358, partial [Eragrostis curvula]
MNNLSEPAGRVPEFLGLLKNLRYLSLSYMPFSGRVPPQLSNLSNLHYLDLSQYMYMPWVQNLHSTDISWLSNLPLRYLNLGNVNLSMAVDWAHTVNMVPSLKVLRLPYCSLTSANQSLPHLNLTNLVELSLSGIYRFINLHNPVESCWFWNLTSLQHLELSATYLYCQIPDAVGGMTSLRVLDFSFSDGRLDSMTTNMTNLCNLEVLDLSDSELNGSIIEILLPQCSANKLKELHFGDNNFAGVLPNWIGSRLSSLVVLELFGNQLTGHVPSEIGMLNNLLTLDISDNRLTGPVPFEVGMLNKLTDLNLAGNNLSGRITHELLDGLQSLTTIDISSNSIKIKVDREWLPPFRLEYAYFASCQMGPQFPTWLQSQDGILELDISSASIFDKLPEWFWTTFSNAWRLDISNNNISGTLSTNLKNMTSLESLFMNSNKITGPIPQLPIFLEEIDISKNFLSGPLPSNFGTQNLVYLSLASNDISGPIPESICKLVNLNILNLAGNLFEGEFPSCFEPRMIRILILHDNRLSGKFPSVFKTCTELGILDLTWNNFSGRLPIWIGNFTMLEVLKLSHNLFSGTIPTTITRLKLLSHLNLACNSLSGTLPRHLSNLSAMAGCKGLYYVIRNPISSNSPVLSEHSTHLNLSVISKGQERYYVKNQIYSINHLSGKIPIKIGAMRSLQSMDLSENNLCGEVPQSLTKLTYLGYLDLSYNNLTGTIPSGGQLDTLYLQNPFMYDGNVGLCGHPLHKNCSENSEPKHGDNKRDEHDSILMSFPFGLGTGYMFGLWVVFCVILFKKAWRIVYFRLFDKVHDKVHRVSAKVERMGWDGRGAVRKSNRLGARRWEANLLQSRRRWCVGEHARRGVHRPPPPHVLRHGLSIARDLGNSPGIFGCGREQERVDREEQKLGP